ARCRRWRPRSPHCTVASGSRVERRHFDDPQGCSQGRYRIALHAGFPMSWHATLQLALQRDGARCVSHVRHEGPLRVLKTLYPEGDAIAHRVTVHPPGGIVGGDRLDITLDLQAHAHAVLTTPGATRFYRSDGAPAAQQVRATLADGARLEWLPLETLAH